LAFFRVIGADRQVYSFFLTLAGSEKKGTLRLTGDKKESLSLDGRG